MTDVQTPPQARYAADTWLRDVEFVDGSTDGGDGEPPVHVTSRMRLNGIDLSDIREDCGVQACRCGGLRVRNDYPYTAATGPDASLTALVVSFVIHEGDIKVPREGDPEARIGPFKVLCPPFDGPDGRPWEPVAEDESGTYWLVHFYVRTAAFVARDKGATP